MYLDHVPSKPYCMKTKWSCEVGDDLTKSLNRNTATQPLELFVLHTEVCTFLIYKTYFYHHSFDNVSLFKQKQLHADELSFNQDFDKYSFESN